MHITFWIVFIPVALISLMFAFPSKAKSIVAELKRRWRLHLIKKYGELEAEYFLEKFNQEYANKFPEELIDEIFDEYKDEIVDRLGKKIVDEKLGEPTPLERYH